MGLTEKQISLLDDLVDFVYNWKSDDTEYNGLIRDKYLIEFVTELQEKIYNEISMKTRIEQIEK